MSWRVNPTIRNSCDRYPSRSLRPYRFWPIRRDAKRMKGPTLRQHRGGALGLTVMPRRASCVADNGQSRSKPTERSMPNAVIAHAPTGKFDDARLKAEVWVSPGLEPMAPVKLLAHCAPRITYTCCTIQTGVASGPGPRRAVPRTPAPTCPAVGLAVKPVGEPYSSAGTMRPSASP